MASVVYNQFKADIANATQDWDDGAATYRVALYTTNPAINADDNFMSDISDGTEATGGGYARVTLANRSVTKDTTNDRAVLDADDTLFAAINAGTINGAAVYKRVGADDSTPSDDRLVAFYDFSGSPFVTNGGDFTIQWNAAGLITLT